MIRSALTVEHIMPQKWQDNWPIPEARRFSDPNLDPHVAALIRAREASVNVLGNLTLITQALNSTVSNGPFSVKMPALKASTALALNRELHDYEDWDEDTIQERGASLLETAKSIWAAPRRAEMPGAGITASSRWSTDREAGSGNTHVRSFWGRYAELGPEARDGPAVGAAVRWRPVPEAGIVVSRFVSGGERVGIFIRGPRGRDYGEEAERLEPFRSDLESALGVPAGNERYPYEKHGPSISHDSSSWDSAARWLIAETDHYVRTVSRIVSK